MIPPYENGNRRYCNETCSYFARLERNNMKYASSKKLLLEFKRVDSILRSFYTEYGSTEYIAACLLNDKEMNWTLFSNQIQIENLPVKVISEYAYCLFTNETIRIWKF